MFANANRLVRASMSLEAVLQDSAERPAQGEVREFAARVDASLAAIADGLRHDRPVHVENLRQAERGLARKLNAIAEGEGRAVAIAIGDACDRIVDSINTLAHLSGG